MFVLGAFPFTLNPIWIEQSLRLLHLDSLSISLRTTTINYIRHVQLLFQINSFNTWSLISLKQKCSLQRKSTSPRFAMPRRFELRWVARAHDGISTPNLRKGSRYFSTIQSLNAFFRFAMSMAEIKRTAILTSHQVLFLTRITRCFRNDRLESSDFPKMHQWC